MIRIIHNHMGVLGIGSIQAISTMDRNFVPFVVTFDVASLLELESIFFSWINPKEW